jgi:hypothetical protein
MILLLASKSEATLCTAAEDLQRWKNGIENRNKQKDRKTAARGAAVCKK